MNAHKKPGHPADRRACAQFAREQRARFPQLHGGWTRAQWNHIVMQAAENKLALLTKARREQQRAAIKNKPKSPRPEGDNTSQGERHATNVCDDIEQQITGRRRQFQLAEIGLTQQATNSTCVTARRGGQRSFSEQQREHAEMVRQVAANRRDPLLAGVYS
jgi:hypothetical protein